MKKGKPPERAGRKARELKRRPFSRRHARPAAIYSNSQLNFIEEEKGIMAKRRALKKLLSLTMALSLAMSLLNVSVFAADGDETAHQHNQMTCPACDGEGYESAPCSACSGTGMLESKETCTKCDGAGEYFEIFAVCDNCNDEEHGLLPDGSTCPVCNGSGYNPRNISCEACNASGVVVNTIDCEA